MSHHREPVKLLGILHWPRAFKPSIHLKDCIWNSGGISWSHCRPNFHSSWNKHLACIMKGAANPNGSNKREKRLSTTRLVRYKPSGKTAHRNVKQSGEANQYIPRTLMNSSSRALSAKFLCNTSVTSELLDPHLANVMDAWDLMSEASRIMLQISSSESQPDKNHLHTNSAGAQWQFQS